MRTFTSGTEFLPSSITRPRTRARGHAGLAALVVSTPAGATSRGAEAAAPAVGSSAVAAGSSCAVDDIPAGEGAEAGDALDAEWLPPNNASAASAARHTT